MQNEWGRPFTSSEVPVVDKNEQYEEDKDSSSLVTIALENSITGVIMKSAKIPRSHCNACFLINTWLESHDNTVIIMLCMNAVSPNNRMDVFSIITDFLACSGHLIYYSQTIDREILWEVQTDDERLLFDKVERCFADRTPEILAELILGAKSLQIDRLQALASMALSTYLMA